MYLATSTNPLVMMNFAQRAQRKKKEPMVHWIIHIDQKLKCDHVAFLQHGIESEKEFLFVPYSVFTVKEIEVSKDARFDPHVIHIYAEPDNKNPMSSDNEQ